jgi:hypothetical protein
MQTLLEPKVVQLALETGILGMAVEVAEHILL